MNRIVILITVLMGLAVMVQAVEPMITQGAREIAVSGSLDEDGEDFGLDLNGRYGHFLLDGIEVGAYAGLGLNGSDDKDVSVGAFGEYNFDIGGQLVPYAGGSAGFAWMDREDADDSYFELQAWGGAKFFFIDYAAFGGELVMKFATEDIYNRYEDGMDWVLRLTTRWFF